MADFLLRLKLAWRVLVGKAVMYRMKVSGGVEIPADCDAMVVECEFRPKVLEVKGDD